MTLLLPARNRRQTAVQAPLPLPVPSRKGSRRSLHVAAGLLLAAAIVAHGNDRRPADPARGGGLQGAVRVRPPADRLRVASFNIHGGRDGQDHRDLAKTAISLEGVQLAGLNEVRGGWRGDQTRYLGQRLGLAWLYAPSERRWWCNHWGNALLSAAPVVRWERQPLTGTRGKGYRNLLLADVAHFGTTVHLLLTHVDTTHDRAAQLQTVVDTFLKLPEPALLLGDLNSDASDPQVQRLLAAPGVIDCLAETAQNYRRRRIDWIVARGLEPRAAGIRDDLASDHPCVWADLAPVSVQHEAAQ